MKRNYWNLRTTVSLVPKVFFASSRWQCPYIIAYVDGKYCVYDTRKYSYTLKKFNAPFKFLGYTSVSNEFKTLQSAQRIVRRLENE